MKTGFGSVRFVLYADNMAPKTYPPYLREKARRLRRERKMTIDQLAECLALPRTTIYYWVRDLPIPRTTRQSLAQRRGTKGMVLKYARLRQAAYEEGRAVFDALCRDRTFRDFVTLYVAEGSKRNRNCVAIGNSDPVVMKIAAKWITRLSTNRPSLSLQYHADQDPEALKAFWCGELGIDASRFRCQRKSNSGSLSGRKSRSRYGVASLAVDDTLLRARLQAWIDCLQQEWLDSVGVGV
jgi:transcriptional regulator with XRE-family HTH domain